MTYKPEDFLAAVRALEETLSSYADCYSRIVDEIKIALKEAEISGTPKAINQVTTVVSKGQKSLIQKYNLLGEHVEATLATVPSNDPPSGGSATEADVELFRSFLGGLRAAPLSQAAPGHSLQDQLKGFVKSTQRSFAHLSLEKAVQRARQWPQMQVAVAKAEQVLRTAREDSSEKALDLLESCVASLQNAVDAERASLLCLTQKIIRAFEAFTSALQLASYSFADRQIRNPQDFDQLTDALLDWYKRLCADRPPAGCTDWYKALVDAFGACPEIFAPQCTRLFLGLLSIPDERWPARMSAAVTSSLVLPFLATQAEESRLFNNTQLNQ